MFFPFRWPYLSIYRLSYMWFACAACLIVLAVGLPVSLADSYRRKKRNGAPDPPVPPELLCPAVESLFGWLPSRRARRWMGRKKVLASEEYSKKRWGRRRKEEEEELEEMKKVEEEEEKDKKVEEEGGEV